MNSFKLFFLALIIFISSFYLANDYVRHDKHIIGRLGELKHNFLFIISPNSFYDKLSSKIVEFSNQSDLVFLNEVIGYKKYSYYGYKPFMIPFLNGNFCSTFSTINFTGWNIFSNDNDIQTIKRCNPDYFIFDISTVDRMLPNSNSPLLLEYIYKNYEIVAIVEEHLLLSKHNKVVSEENINNVSKSISLKNKEITSLEAYNFIKGELKISLINKFLSFIVKPPKYKICFSNNELKNKCFKTSVGRLNSGFFINPIYEFNNDYENKFNLNAKYSQIWFECKHFLMRCNYKFIGELSTRAHTKLNLNSSILFISLREPGFKFTGDYFPRFVENKLLLHAPTEIEFNLKNNSTVISFNYGMLETSYMHGGKSEGVNMNIQLLNNDGITVYSLNENIIPTRESDRIEKNLIIPVPIEAVILRINVNTIGSAGQDHFYLKNIKLN